MKHVYLENTEFAKEARGYLMDYLKLQATLCTAAILVSVSLYKDFKEATEFDHVVIALSLFVASIILTVLTKSSFIAYIVEHERRHVPTMAAGRVLLTLSFFTFATGLLALILMLH
jgi:hypothetical protein